MFSAAVDFLTHFHHNTISLVSENALENLPQLTTLKFDMYCGGCGSIPFWGWLKRNQQFSLFVTCNDYDGEYLYNLQPDNATNCFGEYLCAWF